MADPMTREAAIQAIEANWPTENYTMLREALTLAIAALRAAPPADAPRRVTDVSPAVGIDGYDGERVLAWWPIMTLDDDGNLTDTISEGQWLVTFRYGDGSWFEPAEMEADWCDDEQQYGDGPLFWLPLPGDPVPTTEGGGNQYSSAPPADAGAPPALVALNEVREEIAASANWVYEALLTIDKKIRALVALEDIAMSARRGLAFGHQATPQSPERMIERKEQALGRILDICERHGVTSSVLRGTPAPPAAPPAPCVGCRGRGVVGGYAPVAYGEGIVGSEVVDVPCPDCAPAAPPAVPVGETMPAIQVGDTIVHGKHPEEPPMFMHRVSDYERKGWQGDPNVVEILRPIWRRPTGER